MTRLSSHLCVLFLPHILDVCFHVIDWPIKYHMGEDAGE